MWALLLALSSLAWSAPGGKVIYGPDDRRDLHELTQERLWTWARSSVALISTSAVSVDGDWVRLKTTHYGAEYKLCRGEPFYSQRTAAFCSGVLVEPDLVLTAGHCVPTPGDCEGTKLVFGFSIPRRGHDYSRVPASDVYQCKKLEGYEDVEDGADWALIRLDRPAVGRPVLPVQRADPKAGEPLLLMGYPSGLPLKLAGGARVVHARRRGYFTAELDAYSGNSGSPVLNARTGRVLGVMVRGEADDFVKRGSCYVSNRCAHHGSCGYQEVSKASAIRWPGMKAASVPQDEAVERVHALLSRADAAPLP